MSDLASEVLQLREENERLRKALSEAKRSASSPHTILGMQDVILVIEPGNRVAYANSQAEAMFGKPRAELAQKPLSALVAGELRGEALAKVCDDARASGQAIMVELVDGGGSPSHARYFLATATPDGANVQMVLANRTAQRRAEQALGRYISPQVMQAVLSSGIDPFLARKYELTVLFADLRGFTSLSSQLPAEDVKKLIDEYLTVQIDLVLQEGATLDKIVGDEVMALFGAPLPVEGHALWAVNTALKMQAGHARLMQIWASRGIQACAMGIGINSGPMVVGHIGSKQQMNYTVLGHNVNLGARLCSAAEGGGVLLAPRTFELAREQLTKKPGDAWRPMKFTRGKVLQAKGIAEPIETVNVVLS